VRISLASTKMTDAGAATATFFGVIALLVGLFGKDFYPALVRTGKTKMPTWLGRLWFLVFAGIMFYLSAAHFVRRH
jgi:hypothetical protein